MKISLFETLSAENYTNTGKLSQLILTAKGIASREQQLLTSKRNGTRTEI